METDAERTEAVGKASTLAKLKELIAMRQLEHQNDLNDGKGVISDLVY